jgi:hypothetical protein
MVMYNCTQLCGSHKWKDHSLRQAQAKQKRRPYLKKITKAKKGWRCGQNFLSFFFLDGAEAGNSGLCVYKAGTLGRSTLGTSLT